MYTGDLREVPISVLAYIGDAVYSADSIIFVSKAMLNRVRCIVKPSNGFARRPKRQPLIDCALAE